MFELISSSPSLQSEYFDTTVVFPSWSDNPLAQPPMTTNPHQEIVSPTPKIPNTVSILIATQDQSQPIRSIYQKTLRIQQRIFLGKNPNQDLDPRKARNDYPDLLLEIECQDLLFRVKDHTTPIDQVNQRWNILFFEKQHFLPYSENIDLFAELAAALVIRLCEEKLFNQADHLLLQLCQLNIKIQEYDDFIDSLYATIKTYRDA